jgi:hypothetical protein
MFMAPVMVQANDPPDIVRPDDVGPWGSSRVIPLEGRGLVNRDVIGYSTLPAASRHVDYSSSSIFASVRVKELLLNEKCQPFTHQWFTQRLTPSALPTYDQD